MEGGGKGEGSDVLTAGRRQASSFTNRAATEYRSSAQCHDLNGNKVQMCITKCFSTKQLYVHKYVFSA